MRKGSMGEAFDIRAAGVDQKGGGGARLGRGLWVWYLSKAEGGDLGRMVERARAAHLDWVAIKGGDGVRIWKQLTPAVVQAFRAAGIKVLGWVFVYGNAPAGEARVASAVLATGCDGLIVDAEQAYEGKPDQATAYLAQVRAQFPQAFIAYSTFPLISLHPGFPYREFGRYCDAAMPQCYWQDIGMSVAAMFERTRREWSTWAKEACASGWGESVKPVLPVGQGYGGVDGPAIQEFLRLTAEEPGVSLWEWSQLSPGVWEVLEAFAG
ncbi:MAG: hypothetical protein IMW99_02240 [Firmicutes bacterium]|nr:hypothetical protein [Bacillota bacterium]